MGGLEKRPTGALEMLYLRLERCVAGCWFKCQVDRSELLLVGCRLLFVVVVAVVAVVFSARVRVCIFVFSTEGITAKITFET